MSARTRRLLTVGLVVGGLMIAGIAAFAFAGQKLSREVYGFSVDTEGTVLVRTSPCFEPIGLVEVATAVDGLDAEVIFSAELLPSAEPLHAIPIGKRVDGYRVEIDPHFAATSEKWTLWRLRDADGSNLIAVLHSVDAASLVPGQVVRGDGKVVTLEQWEDC